MFGTGTMSFDRIVLWVDRAYLDRTINFGHALNRCFERASAQQGHLLRPDGSTLQLMQTLLENINVELEKEQFAFELTADTCLVQFMILLNRLEEKGGQSPEMLDRSGSVVGKVLAYINDHYHEDLSLDLLANRFFISKYHLSREFNRLVGTSVYRYITQKRLAVAKQMLSEGVPSSEAYQQCGFGDYSSFYRAFRSEYRISPKEFVSKLKEATAMAQARAERRG
jgi:AraC-like DNA-binding protein